MKQPTPAQQRILHAMEEGIELYEILSIVEGATNYRSGALHKPNSMQFILQRIGSESA